MNHRIVHDQLRHDSGRGASNLISPSLLKSNFSDNFTDGTAGKYFCLFIEFDSAVIGDSDRVSVIGERHGINSLIRLNGISYRLKFTPFKVIVDSRSLPPVVFAIQYSRLRIGHDPRRRIHLSPEKQSRSPFYR